MINFFRKIRKQLSDDNKPIKYFRYAIGEIVLVMIGILLALQVNNLNENRKNIILEKEYLKSLKGEFSNNLTTFKRHVHMQERTLEMANMLLDLLELDSIPSNPNKIPYAIEYNGWSNKITLTTNVWDDLYSTGNSGLIRNTELLNSFSVMNASFKGYLSLLDEWEAYTMYFRKIVGGILPPRLRIDATTNPVDFWNKGEMKINVPFNKIVVIERFKEVEGIGNALADIIMLREVAILISNRHIKRVENLLLEIDIELQLKDD